MSKGLTQKLAGGLAPVAIWALSVEYNGHTKSAQLNVYRSTSIIRAINATYTFLKFVEKGT